MVIIIFRVQWAESWWKLSSLLLENMDFPRPIWLYSFLLILTLPNLILCHDRCNNQAGSNSCTSQYSESCNANKNDLTTDEMFKRGHMKPFGSHRPPDFIVEELPYMISPQDFYMNYVAKHKPVVFKGIVFCLFCLILNYFTFSCSICYANYWRCE